MVPLQEKLEPITRARMDWSDAGHPVSWDFGDVYFSRDDGLSECRHVFLAGNGLPDAWARQHHFTICELGFGTGLNFLAAWELWRITRQPGARLNYVSIEGFPLEPSDLAKSLRPWPELSILVRELVQLYPFPHRGYHRLYFDDGVTLTIVMDDVLRALEGLDAGVDVWFLDGFAPRCNADMWDQDVCVEMSRLSRRGASLATFTVAGSVRRHLQRAGFVVEQSAGFGRKRSMLRGRFSGRPLLTRGAPWYRQPQPQTPGSALIVGGGIAGCSVAAALRRRNWKCTIVERGSALAQGASGNETGIIMPRLTADLSPDGRFYAESFRATVQHLTHPSLAAAPVEHDLCGVIQLGAEDIDSRRHTALVEAGALPNEMLKALMASEASDIAGVSVDANSLYFPQGGWLDPAALCGSLAAECDVLLELPVQTLSHEDGRWYARDENDRAIADADIVVVANGADAYRFLELALLPLEAFRGQITYLPETKESAKLKSVVAFGSYITPSHQSRHILGATYKPLSRDAPAESLLPRIADDRYNVKALRNHLPFFADPLDSESYPNRVSVRCTTPDRNPVVGAMPDVQFFNAAYAGIRHGQIKLYPEAHYVPGLYVHLGLGSRGYTTALLSAELIASQIAGDPLPVERALADLVHPGRFIMRALRYDRDVTAAN